MVEGYPCVWQSGRSNLSCGEPVTTEYSRCGGIFLPGTRLATLPTFLKTYSNINMGKDIPLVISLTKDRDPPKYFGASIFSRLPAVGFALMHTRTGRHI